MSRNFLGNILGAWALILLLAVQAEAGAGDSGQPLNPVKDITWQNVFPIKIGGVAVKKAADNYDTPDLVRKPVCTCPQPGPISRRTGLPISFWEPARMVETVKTPYYFPTFGSRMGGERQGKRQGSMSSAAEQETTFAQAHWYVFPAWAAMGLFLDFVACQEPNAELDLAFMTEIDPTWNEDTLAMFLNPEAALLANPVAQAACIPDSIAAAAGRPIDTLFWCMGAWGSVYPMAGLVGSGNPVQANAALAGRMTAKMARQLLLPDTTTNICQAMPMPVWQKSQYKYQIARPVVGAKAMQVGKPGVMWSGGKNPSWGSDKGPADNFLWSFWRKRACCAF